MNRTDYISWNEYFMSIALLSTYRSKDPHTQVGACIINDDRRIVAVGYNGMPNGCIDAFMPWDREAESSLDTKYPYVCHAELNAILNSTQNLKGCTLYVTLFPCNECAKAIIQSGIKKVVYMENKYDGTDSILASMKLFNDTGVEVEQYPIHNTTITLNI